jgi:inosine-uridine nucleoside N-ribohydrolase
MLHVLEILGKKDIPMFLGAKEPLKNTAKNFERMKREWGGTGYAGAFGKARPINKNDLLPPSGGKFSKLRPQKSSAIDFIIDTVEKYPNKITFLALGPHTNLYKAIKKKPSIAKKIKRLVFMGGNANVPGNTTPHAEFNFFFDPEAAQFVLRSDIPEKIMFGLDITNKAVITHKHFTRIAGLHRHTPIISLFAEDMGDRWPGFSKNPHKTGFIWDCLAAGYLIDPSFVTKSQDMYVDVITSDGPAYGGVTAYPVSKKPGKKTKKVKVMLNLDFDKFFGMYRKLLTRPI